MRRSELQAFLLKGVYQRMRIGIVGDFSPKSASQTAVNQALLHSSHALGISLVNEWIPTATIGEQWSGIKDAYDGFWIGPGYPDAVDGVLRIIQFARERDIPLLGTCGGFQYMIMEYARNKMKLTNADHEERNPDASRIVISQLRCPLVGQKGEVLIKKPSRLFELYQVEKIYEHFMCSFGLSPDYERRVHEAGLSIVATDVAGNARAVELPAHRFFIGTLYVPQLSSAADAAHCLIDAFIASARVRAEGGRG